jgi:hypothetical protein
MNANLEELRRLASRADNQRTETGIPRVAMVQGEIPAHKLAAVYDPMVNLILHRIQDDDRRRTVPFTTIRPPIS